MRSKGVSRDKELATFKRACALGDPAAKVYIVLLASADPAGLLSPGGPGDPTAAEVAARLRTDEAGLEAAMVALEKQRLIVRLTGGGVRIVGFRRLRRLAGLIRATW